MADSLLIIADSEHDANMLYAARLFVPDPFIYLRLHGRDYVVMSDLEIDRARKQAKHCRVLPLTQLQQKLRARGVKRPGLADVAALLLREKKIRRVLVPNNFPLGIANDLAKQKISVRVKTGGFFPEREIKSPAEVRHLVAALRMAETGMAAGIAALRSSKIGKRVQAHLPERSAHVRTVARGD